MVEPGTPVLQHVLLFIKYNRKQNLRGVSEYLGTGTATNEFMGGVPLHTVSLQVSTVPSLGRVTVALQTCRNRSRSGQASAVEEHAFRKSGGLRKGGRLWLGFLLAAHSFEPPQTEAFYFRDHISLCTCRT